MQKSERYLLYEKLYFRELDRIEKVSARLGLPFAVLLSVVALLSYLLNSLDRTSDGLWIVAFWLLFAGAVISLVAGAWFFRMAWFGHTDKYLPTAIEIENYHLQLENTYKEETDKDRLIEEYFSDFLFNYYAQFSSENAVSNDTRSYNIYRTIVALAISILFASTALIPFYLGNLNMENSNYDQTKSTTASSATTST